MELVLFSYSDYLPDGVRHSESFNSDPFVGRVASVLIEHDVKISYGEYFCKVKTIGHIKVLKSLGLYKTKGRGAQKKVFIHPLVLLVVKTTISKPNIIAQTIRELFDGVYRGFYVDIRNMSIYQKIEMKLKPTINGGFYTYIFLNPTTKIYKIGRTRSIFTRLKQIQYEHGENNIKLVAYLNEDKEAELHFLHKDNRLFGEWFDLSPDMVHEIIQKYKFESFV